MYLHLGLDMMVDARKIIGIFDIKTFRDDLFSHINKKNGVSKENSSSYVLTEKEIFFSEISPVTLKKRFESLFTDDLLEKA